MVQRCQIEVSCFVGGLGGGSATFIGFEQEEFQLGAAVECVIAHIGSTLQGALQNAAGVAHKGSAVGIIYVAQETSHLAFLGSPGQDDEGIQIGVQILVGFVDTGKAFDGGAVNADLVVQRSLQLRCGDGHILHGAENIGKLHTDELYVFFLHNADNIFTGVLCHSCKSPLQTEVLPLSKIHENYIVFGRICQLDGYTIQTNIRHLFIDNGRKICYCNRYLPLSGEGGTACDGRGQIIPANDRKNKYAYIHIILIYDDSPKEQHPYD